MSNNKEISNDKDYQALYFKYKTKYLDLKNSGGARFTANSSLSRTRRKSPSSPKSKSLPKPIVYKTKFDTLSNNGTNFTNSANTCFNNIGRTCTPEEIIKTYENLMYDHLKDKYSEYITKYPELLAKINKAASEWAEFIKKEMNENKTCKTKMFASLRCDNFTNYASKNSSGNKLIAKYNAKKISFFNNIKLKPDLFVDFLDVAISPNYEQYIQNSSKLIIQNELPFKPTNINKNEIVEYDIMKFYTHYDNYKNKGFI